MRPIRVCAALWVALCVISCGTGAAPGDETAGDDPDPVFTVEERARLMALAPDTLPHPDDASNQYADSEEAAALGQRLFFDASFSGVLWDGDNSLPNSGSLGSVGETGKVSCASCHVPSGAFADNRSMGNSTHSVSLGAGWTLRRSPSLLDVAAARMIMWDGHRDSLFSQVFGPIESNNEMNSSRLFVAEQIFAKHRTEYEAIFGPMPPLDDPARFPPLTPETTGCQKIGVGPGDFECHGMPGDGAEFDGMAPADQDAVTRVVVNAGKAIGAYERLLSCGQGRFDAWAHGEESAMSRAEQRGAALFVGRAKCVDCHEGPFFSDQKFHNTGLLPKPVAVVILDADDNGAIDGLAGALSDPLNTKSAWSDGDDGRLPASVGPGMLGAFRTPTLRCVAKRPSFMHTGQMQTLEEVVDFFAAGGHAHGYPGTKEIAPLDLSEREKSELATFLRALDGPGPPQKLLQ